MVENKHVPTRLRPIIHHYLEELAKLGPYGKGKAGVVRHFVETGIVRALEAGVLNKRDVRDFGETLEENEKED
jgi:hypothetical protein